MASVMPDRFHVCLTPGAEKDFKELDGSVKPIVLEYLKRLRVDADTMGESLRNDQNSKLAGCRKLKLLKAGIRIVYKISDEKVEVLAVAVLNIAMVLTIEKRKDYKVYKIAQERLIKSAEMTLEDYNTAVKRTLKAFQEASTRFKK
jgi:mRNA interferase RelE/StbE